MATTEQMLSEKFDRLHEILTSDKSSAAEKKWAEEQMNDVIKELKPYRDTCKDILKQYGIGLLVTCVPILLYWGNYFRAQRNVLEFEKDGSIRSTAGRDLRLPSFSIFKSLK